MWPRTVAIVAQLSLVMPTLALAQGNNPQPPGSSGKPPGGTRPPGSGGQPAFRPGGPPGGTRTFVVPHAGPQPGFARPPPGVVAPAPPGVVAPPHPGVVGSPQPGFAGPQPGGSAHQFVWRGRAFERVHAAPFVYPSGFTYRRWAVGAILPPLFLAPDFFYPDWEALGLDPPPPYYQWVRYGPDLLLVNLSTGEVTDTIYDVE